MEDVIANMPSAYLTEEDHTWLRQTWDKMAYLVPAELPPEAQGDPEQARKYLLEEVLTPARLEIRAVHNLTVEELMKSFRQMPELPLGMTTADVRALYNQVEMTGEEQKQLDDLHNLTEEVLDNWRTQVAFNEALRSTVIRPPKITVWEELKMLALQPVLAVAEVADMYFGALPRPLAAAAILAFPWRKQDSSAAELERLYNQYREEGIGAWEAYSEAYENWGYNT